MKSQMFAHSPGLSPIQSTSSFADADQRIADSIRQVAKQANRPIRILEAGCGNRWPLVLGDIDYHLTGVDLDAAALDIRCRVRKDLNEAIHGDLCSVALAKESFDVVYSAYVLEHIARADQALTNMTGALRAGGLLVLSIPDPQTARGLVTRATPFWFHVFYHRWVLNRRQAGTPGHAPYPTYYHPVIYRAGLAAFARERNLECIAVYADTFARYGRGLGGLLFRAAARILDGLSVGHFTSRYNNLTYIFQKS
ncbi:MAG: class I SAM-dependent methyltransferase [Steroidobacteraceae bacterium]